MNHQVKRKTNLEHRSLLHKEHWVGNEMKESRAGNAAHEVNNSHRHRWSRWMKHRVLRSGRVKWWEVLTLFLTEKYQPQTSKRGTFFEKVAGSLLNQKLQRGTFSRGCQTQQSKTNDGSSCCVGHHFFQSWPGVFRRFFCSTTLKKFVKCSSLNGE